jgi:hypothetical protein
MPDGEGAAPVSATPVTADDAVETVPGAVAAKLDDDDAVGVADCNRRNTSFISAVLADVGRPAEAANPIVTRLAATVGLIEGICLVVSSVSSNPIRNRVVSAYARSPRRFLRRVYFKKRALE